MAQTCFNAWHFIVITLRPDLLTSWIHESVKWIFTPTWLKPLTCDANWQVHSYMPTWNESYLTKNAETYASQRQANLPARPPSHLSASLIDCWGHVCGKWQGKRECSCQLKIWLFLSRSQVKRVTKTWLIISIVVRRQAQYEWLVVQLVADKIANGFMKLSFHCDVKTFTKNNLLGK